MLFVGLCRTNLNYFISGCLRQEFKEYCTVGKTYDIDGDEYTYPNCTMPWHQSMLGILEYNDSEVEVCNEADSSTLNNLDYLFLRKASQKTTRCKGKLFSYRIQNFRGKPLE